MKKTATLLLSALFTASTLTGCANTPAMDNLDQLHIVSTIFPTYDWTQQILGDTAKEADLTLLLDQGVDLHSYQPTADDLIKISGCDLFIYVGGESDTWVEKALQNPTNEKRIAINLLEVLGDAVKTEETIEGMEHSHHHDDADYDEHHEDHEHEEESDEHVWLSLRNAKVLCEEIANQLSVVDPTHKDTYAQNITAYAEKLSELDVKYAETVTNGSKNTLLFGDRFPFRYLVDDYGLNYYAAFSGCSAETEASFKTVAFLANKVNELNLPCVLTIEGRQHKIAQTIIDNTDEKNQQVLTLNSMQSTTAEDLKNGATYLSIMENNLQVLKDALQ